MIKNKIRVGLFTLLSIVTIDGFANHLMLRSSSITPNGVIPIQFTCDGDNYSPPLNWTDTNKDTKSYALVVERINESGQSWVNWLVFNIPTRFTGFPEAVTLPAGVERGRNSWGTKNYRGPCTKGGPYAYHFQLYALDTRLKRRVNESSKEIKKAIKMHAIDSTEFIAFYGKPVS
jgi:Raf kinase inhibitor-like YbhB/YbcL family protein